MLAAVLSKVPLLGRPAHHGAPAGATGGCLRGGVSLSAGLSAGRQPYLQRARLAAPQRKGGVLGTVLQKHLNELRAACSTKWSGCSTKSQQGHLLLCQAYQLPGEALYLIDCPQSSLHSSPNLAPALAPRTRLPRTLPRAAQIWVGQRR